MIRSILLLFQKITQFKIRYTHTEENFEHFKDLKIQPHSSNQFWIKTCCAQSWGYNLSEPNLAIVFSSTMDKKSQVKPYFWILQTHQPPL